MIKRYKITIYGKVQGVGFRYAVKDMAEELKLNGIVRNNSDGTVYTEVEGKQDRIDMFLAWCKHGPEWSEVEKVEHEAVKDLNNFQSFKIIS